MRRPVAIVSFLGFWLSACNDGAAECNTSSDCATDSVCVESRCRVACNRKVDCPAGQYCVQGACHEVECVPGVRCDDGNPCTEDDECDVLGSCVGLPVVCDQIPAPECVDADTRRTYSAGRCLGGECVYPYSNTSCPGCPSCDATACTIGEDLFGAGAVNPANGCEFCDLAEPTAWTAHTCGTGSSTNPCRTNTGTCDPTLDWSSCQLDDCCEVAPNWPTGSTGSAPSCPLGQEDTNHDGIEDNGETWTGSCTHAGECIGCSSNEDCDDGDPCSADTCDPPFCERDWTTRLGQTCALNAADDGRCIDAGSRAECKLIDGEPCNPEEPSQCEDGWCIDGVCCDSACNGACRSCDGAETVGSDGQCSDITAGTDPGSECTGGFACNGGACAMSCSPSCGIDPDNCDPGSFCDSSNSCSPLRSDGTVPDAACGAVSCASGSAADGYCCNSDCLGQCQSCDGSETISSSGVCANIVAGTDPASECPGGLVCNGGSCATSCSPSCGIDPDNCDPGSFCDSSNNCSPLRSSGTVPDATCGAVSCGSGSAADGYCCNSDCLGECQSCDGAVTGESNGQCSDIVAGTDPAAECPGGFACNGGSCATSCVSCNDFHACEAGYYCDSGACSLLLEDGTPQDATCGASSCSSGNAADGYCCNSACDGTCMSCGGDNPYSVPGVCVLYIFGATDDYPSAICVGNAGCLTSDCACDGSGGCLGTAGSTGCTSGAQCLYGVCSLGTCEQP